MSRVLVSSFALAIAKASSTVRQEVNGLLQHSKLSRSDSQESWAWLTDPVNNAVHVVEGVGDDLVEGTEDLFVEGGEWIAEGADELVGVTMNEVFVPLNWATQMAELGEEGLELAGADAGVIDNIAEVIDFLPEQFNAGAGMLEDELLEELWNSVEDADVIFDPAEWGEIPMDWANTVVDAFGDAGNLAATGGNLADFAEVTVEMAEAAEAMGTMVEAAEVLGMVEVASNRSQAQAAKDSVYSRSNPMTWDDVQVAANDFFAVTSKLTEVEEKFKHRFNLETEDIREEAKVFKTLASSDPSLTQLKEDAPTRKLAKNALEELLASNENLRIQVRCGLFKEAMDAFNRYVVAAKTIHVAKHIIDTMSHNTPEGRKALDNVSQALGKMIHHFATVKTTLSAAGTELLSAMVENTMRVYNVALNFGKHIMIAIFPQVKVKVHLRILSPAVDA